MKIICIGGSMHNTYQDVSTLHLQREERLAFCVTPVVSLVEAFVEHSPSVAETLDVEYYDIIPVEDRGEVIDYYAKACSMSLEESFDLYVVLRC